MKTFFLISCLAFLITISGCKKSSAVIEVPKDVQMARMKADFSWLNGTDWVLKDYAANPLPAKLKNTLTLKFKKQSDTSYQISGRSFVNWYGGAFNLDEEKGLVVNKEHLVTTEMAGPPESMKAEETYYQHLQKASYFKIEGNELWLYIGSNTNAAEEVMYFTKK
ncbi:META domain-containing protein [Runella aurantiaca]|uniref:META domain-containing protein n=1 Tax=Runella aurantiaca TaxID=2282308 RepID=A0A369ICL0_9BACT|nr:META domain-containing protein [Runella aurantiaca]RDB06005.1 META domain-containing protein [Runella aurantiaca]